MTVVTRRVERDYDKGNFSRYPKLDAGQSCAYLSNRNPWNPTDCVSIVPTSVRMRCEIFRSYTYRA